MLNLTPDNIHSDYLDSCFRNLNSVVKQVVKNLKPHADRFEAIAVRGTSGLLVGPMVASLLKKPWCVVRKENDGTHSTHGSVEGWYGFSTYIIIDDLIATGTTMSVIQRLLHDYSKEHCYTIPLCVGFYLFNSDEIIWRGNGTDYSCHDRYFHYPDVV